MESQVPFQDQDPYLTGDWLITYEKKGGTTVDGFSGSWCSRFLIFSIQFYFGLLMPFKSHICHLYPNCYKRFSINQNPLSCYDKITSLFCYV